MTRCTAFLLVAMLAVTSASFAMSVEEALENAVEIEALQPPSRLVERIEHRPDADSAQPGFDISLLPYMNGRVVIEDYTPYYPYYALKDGSQHVIHPMGLGRFLLGNAESEVAARLTEAALGLAYELPNGGLAWYYPKHYQVARMLGHELKYSSISQGTILAGLLSVSEENEEISIDLARGVFLAMEWPFERGGINLSDRALLEMPSFAGPPEIILNGWIDALLHIRDYSQATGDQEAAALFSRNTAFLTEILPLFDSREAMISRYSDVSPYRAEIRLSSPNDIGSLKVLYVPRYDFLPPILVWPERNEGVESFSPYDNQIVRLDGREALIWLSCSQLYETVVIAESESMTLEVNTGSIVRDQSTPGYGGETLSIASELITGGQRVVRIGPDQGLICGYPTNFSKGGATNHYHVYHVVGLMLLALGGDVPPDQARVMLEWSARWRDDMETLSGRGLRFEDPQDLLDATNSKQFSPEYDDYGELLEAAQSFLRH